MNVETTKINKVSCIVSVIVNGECNHHDSRVEIQDFGFPSLDVDGEPGYVEDDRQVIICNKCGAWRYTLEQEWCGVTVLSEPFVTNKGELLHDVQPMPF